MTAPLPPSSSVTLGVSATRRRRQPTAGLPVNDTILTRGSRTSPSARSVRHGTTLTAGGERGTELVRHQEERRVERRDREHGADGEAAREADPALAAGHAVDGHEA